jgi:hypothetical protein
MFWLSSLPCKYVYLFRWYAINCISVVTKQMWNQVPFLAKKKFIFATCVEDLTIFLFCIAAVANSHAQ